MFLSTQLVTPPIVEPVTLAFAKQPYGLIYLLRNRVNGKVYVGQTTQTVAWRWSKHVKDSRSTSPHCPYLAAAIRKYGPDTFDVVTLHQALSKADLDEMETGAIWTHDARNPNLGYNLKDGGASGKHAEESKRKMSAARKGRPARNRGIPHTTEAKAAMSQAQTGRTHAEATKAKIGAANKGKKRSPEQCAALSHRVKSQDKSHLNTFDSITKRAESNRRFWSSPEAKARRAAINKATWKRVKEQRMRAAA